MGCGDVEQGRQGVRLEDAPAGDRISNEGHSANYYHTAVLQVTMSGKQAMSCN